MFKDQPAQSTDHLHKPKVRTKKTCFLFASGNCKFGDHCRYLHVQDEVLNQSESDSHPPSSETSQTGPSTDRGHIGNTKEKRVCRYFSLHGTCKFGDGCRFHHEVVDKTRENPPSESSKVQETTENDDHDDKENEAETTVPNEKNKARKTVCRYFKRGYCSNRARCRFLHQLKDKESPIDENVEKKDGGVSKDGNSTTPAKQQRRRYVSHPPTRGPVPARPQMLLKDMHIGDLLKLRSTEIKQLKTRFPTAEVIERGDSESDQYRVQVSSSDPDWPYDVKDIVMLISFPMDYPKEAMEVFLPKDQDLPDTVRRHVLRAVEGYIKEKHKTLQLEGRMQLEFRPFLRWLDRKMEILFTEGLKMYQKELMAKAAGFEFIPASHLQENIAEAEQQQAGSDAAESEGEQEEGSDQSDSGCSEDETDSEDESAEEEEVRQTSTGSSTDPIRRGTEVKFKSLQLLEGAATLLLNKGLVVVQCSRCKHRQEVSTPEARINSMQCAQCHNEEVVTFRASMAHQFTSVVGYMDMLGCTAFDLVLSECTFSVGCLGCSKNIPVEGLNPGQVKSTWCQHCHQKLSIATEGAKFTQLQPSGILDTDKAHKVSVQKITRAVRDPAIQSGKPLPDEGTCKHYKKSYRWFRFPCCGKAYPCDICHDSNENHEMKLANRMICGFCAKEQPFSLEKACNDCGSALTKRVTEHWEGGRGCRDRVKMSRNDPQKYSSQNKTMSKKAQAKQQPKKKTVKIRHASK